LRRRFDQEGIQIPFPERVVTVRDDDDKSAPAVTG
jgi:small-conductance mechanosensitive channel